MNKILFSIIATFLLAVPAYAQNIKVAGIASKGGKIVRTSANVQHIVMETFPSSTITVYQTGTLTLASIFSDEIGTAKSNPFTANSDASWSFYIAPGRYDIKFSGTGIISPFTLSDIFVNSGGGGEGGAVTSVFGRTGDVVYQVGDVPFTGLNFTGSNFNLITIRSASDLNAGTLPDARFPVILPALSGINLTNLNASNITSGTLNDTRLSTNVPLKNTSNTFTQNNLFNANVGINTLTPDRRLEVLDGSNAQLRLSAVDSSAFTDFFVDSGGSLNFLPTGNIAFDATGNQVNPLNNFDQNLGQINKKWLSLHAAELFVETIVAQNTIATIGGRIIVAPTNILITDLSSVATTISVKYNNLANGDRLYMEGNNSVEFMAVTSGASVISGGFSYTVIRNLDGTGANDWFAGDALVNTGVSGDGFIDLYSVRGVKSGTQIGPTIVGNIRNSTTFNDWTENWAIGNLNGLYGYGSDVYGVALGKYAAGNAHVTIDSVSGYRIFSGLSTIIGQWDNSGVITVGEVGVNKSNLRLAAGNLQVRTNEVVWGEWDGTTGNITVGLVAAGFSNVRIDGSGNLRIRNNLTDRIFLGADGSGFLANNQISWNSSGTFTVNDNAIIGGWTIDPTLISSTGINIASGANAHLAFGTIPPTSTSFGTGIFLDRTGLYGLLSSVVQVKLDATTGAITAGAGNVTLDANGLVLIPTVDASSTIRWREVGAAAYSGSISVTRQSTSTQTIFDTLSRQGLDDAGVATLNILTTNTSLFSTSINVKKYGVSHATRASKGFISLGALDGVIIEPAFSDQLPTASTALEVKSTTGAFIPPKMTTTQRDALTPTSGMMIYNTTTNKHQGYDGTIWNDMY